MRPCSSVCTAGETTKSCGISSASHLTDEEVRAHGAAKERLFRETIRPVIQEALVPGVREFLERHRDQPIGLATNAEPANVEFLMEAAHLRPYFRAVVDGHQVPNPKPHPDIYLRAARLLGTEPARLRGLRGFAYRNRGGAGGRDGCGGVANHARANCRASIWRSGILTVRNWSRGSQTDRIRSKCHDSSLLLLVCRGALFGQKYKGPQPEKPDLPYLVHADNLVATEASEAKEQDPQGRGPVLSSRARPHPRRRL